MTDGDQRFALINGQPTKQSSPTAEHAVHLRVSFASCVRTSIQHERPLVACLAFLSRFFAPASRRLSRLLSVYLCTPTNLIIAPLTGKKQAIKHLTRTQAIEVGEIASYNSINSLVRCTEAAKRAQHK